MAADADPDADADADAAETNWKHKVTPDRGDLIKRNGCNSFRYMCLLQGWGTKISFVNFFVSTIFGLAKAPLINRTRLNFHLSGGHWDRTIKIWKHMCFLKYVWHYQLFHTPWYWSKQAEWGRDWKNRRWWKWRSGKTSFEEYVIQILVTKYSQITIATTCKQLVMTRTHHNDTHTDKVHVTRFLEEGRYTYPSVHISQIAHVWYSFGYGQLFVKYVTDV